MSTTNRSCVICDTPIGDRAAPAIYLTDDGRIYFDLVCPRCVETRTASDLAECVELRHMAAEGSA